MYKKEINKIPTEILDQVGLFSSDYDDGDSDRSTTLRFSLEQFFQKRQEEELIAYRVRRNEETDPQIREIIIWTTNYVLFSTYGFMGNYLGYMPRNPHPDDSYP